MTTHMHMRQLFVHNFVHGDLHPGNILVQEQEAGTTPCLVLLDCGLATSLTQKDLEDFRKTFIMIVKNKVLVFFLLSCVVCMTLLFFPSLPPSFPPSLREVTLQTCFYETGTVPHSRSTDRTWTNLLTELSKTLALTKFVDSLL